MGKKFPPAALAAAVDKERKKVRDKTGSLRTRGRRSAVEKITTEIYPQAGGKK